MPRNRLPIRRFLVALALTLTTLTSVGWPRVSDAEPQAFHHIEINKLLVGYNGNMNIQAVELKLISAGEVFVAGAFIAVYDSVGDPVATLGTFANNVANGSVGDRILCATAGFASAFSITPDLVINPGIPMVTGQVSFETPTCLINSLPYGNVLARVSGTSNATPLPPHGATVLVRTADNPFVPSCPLAENAAQRFQLRGAGNASPHVFQNNARDTAQVWTTVTLVEPEPVPPVVRRLSASPNPFTARTTVRLPDRASRVSVYDVRGRLVRSWEPSSYESGELGAAVHWDGRDEGARQLPSGLYFMEAVTTQGPIRGRVILLRQGLEEHHSH
ncbi:MAG TPA: hypothetical protein VFP58_08335 [Candidatus Eisenbacteria bacterium]|nr:hypothetical protein [Candidatus Eisenbacteria bacterium]